MLLSEFIATQSTRLSEALERYWQQECTYKQLCLVTWDIVETWNKMTLDYSEHLSDQEQMFWYSLYQIQYLHKDELQHSEIVRLELHQALYCAQHNTRKPFHCVSMRP